VLENQHKRRIKPSTLPKASRYLAAIRIQLGVVPALHNRRAEADASRLTCGHEMNNENIPRSLVERFFNKIKRCRCVATRYAKLVANYLAFVKLACIRLWLRAYESTA